MTPVRVAILGTCGWMGKTHTVAYQSLPFHFGNARGAATIRWLVDANVEKLNVIARNVPGVRTGDDWRQAVEDPDIDLVDICLPDNFHYEVAKAALLANKHVYCEKPLARNAAEARELADMAVDRGLVTRVGHNFPRNPIHDVAKDIIESGEIGDIKMFQAAQHVDVLADPDTPFMWRCDGDLAPTGAVGDIGSHLFSFADRLVGRISSLTADCHIVTPRRREVADFNYGATTGAKSDTDKMREVTNADAGHVMCRFDNGAMGLMDFSRVATGRKFQQTYEVYGTRGALSYTYDETNRLRFYSSADPLGRQGFRAIDVGPENADYGAFLPVPNFSLGYNETKVIEIAEVIEAVSRGTPAWPTFETGHHIAQIIDAVLQSSHTRDWVEIS